MPPPHSDRGPPPCRGCPQFAPPRADIPHWGNLTMGGGVPMPLCGWVGAQVSCPPPPQTHTHTHTPAGRCYGNSAWELFATDRAESPSLQPFPWLWDCGHAVPTVQPGGPEGGGHSCGRNSSYFLWSCGTGLPGGLGPGGGQPHRVILGCERGRALGKRAEMGQLPQVPKAQRYPQPRLQETPGGAR